MVRIRILQKSGIPVNFLEWQNGVVYLPYVYIPKIWSNVHIFGLFTRMQVVEKVGSGIPRMRRLMKDTGLPEPKFDTQGFFTITFLKRPRLIVPPMAH